MLSAQTRLRILKTEFDVRPSWSNTVGNADVANAMSRLRRIPRKPSVNEISIP